MVIGNKLFESDEETGSLIRVMSAGIDGNEKTVVGNTLFERDAETNALIPVVKVLGGSGGGGTGNETPGNVNRLLTMGPPDYANMESTNRISTNNGTWTVNRDGYVYLDVGGSSGDQYGYINDKLILHHTDNNASSYSRGSGVFQVSTGDVIRMQTTGSVLSGFGCYFIPTVINPPVYVSGQPLINYSTVEQDTGIKWIDGRKIYQRTFTGNWTATANGYVTVESGWAGRHVVELLHLNRVPIGSDTSLAAEGQFLVRINNGNLDLFNIYASNTLSVQSFTIRYCKE